MRPILRHLVLPIMASVLGLAFLISPNGVQIVAQQQPQRPTITATILLREGDKITLDRGSQNGLRKGDKLQVSHNLNGGLVAGGTIVITRVMETTAEAKVTEQTGTIGPEDIAVFDPAVAPMPTSTPKPTAPPPPARAVPAEPTRKVPREPAKSTSPAAVVKADPTLPLFPQFSSDPAAGAAFAFDFTNEAVNVADTSVYYSTARLIYDNQNYRTLPVTLIGNYSLDPGKTRPVTFKLSDFTLANDKTAWPVKSGRHTVLIKFGGKEYGPLTFDWR